MSITGATLVQDAMFQAGVLGQDQATGAQSPDIQLVLRRLNRMVASINNLRLLIFSIASETLNLTAGVATYSTALLAGGRPVNIEDLRITYAGVVYHQDIITQSQYNSIAIPTIAAIPTQVYIDAAFPQMFLTFFPVPYAPMVASIDVRRALVGAIDLATVVALPDGYDKMLVDVLAVDICPSFQKSATPDMLRSANEAKRVLKTTNYTPIVASVDFTQDPSNALANQCKPW